VGRRGLIRAAIAAAQILYSTFRREIGLKSAAFGVPEVGLGIKRIVASRESTGRQPPHLASRRSASKMGPIKSQKCL
jgi:hypothetical protein